MLQIFTVPKGPLLYLYGKINIQQIGQVVWNGKLSECPGERASTYIHVGSWPLGT